jgi:hypothetical protein
VLLGTGPRTFGVKAEWRQALDDWIAGAPDRAFAAHGRCAAGASA